MNIINCCLHPLVLSGKWSKRALILKQYNGHSIDVTPPTNYRSVNNNNLLSIPKFDVLSVENVYRYLLKNLFR